MFIVPNSPACPVWGCTGGEVHNDMRLFIVPYSPACPVWGRTGGEVHNDMRLCLLCPSSSIVYHRLIYSTQSVGAMLWSMAQLRRGQLRMVVDVVGSC